MADAMDDIYSDNDDVDDETGDGSSSPEFHPFTQRSYSPGVSVSIANGNGFNGLLSRTESSRNTVESHRSRNGLTTMIVRSGSSWEEAYGDRVIQKVTSYAFKFYFILGLLSVSLYAVFHLYTSVHELQSDMTRTMANFQIQLQSELTSEFRKFELRYVTEIEDLKSELATKTLEMNKLMKEITIKQMKDLKSELATKTLEISKLKLMKEITIKQMKDLKSELATNTLEMSKLMKDITIKQMEDLKSELAIMTSEISRLMKEITIKQMEDLKSELATMTSEMSKPMKKITIKQMETENSVENSQQAEPDNYYSKMLKYVRIQPEIAKVQKQLSPSSAMEKMNVFRELLRKQRAVLRAQPRHTWVDLYSSIVSTFSPTSTRPSTIVLLIPPQVQFTQFPSCFARKLGNDVNYVFNGHHKTVLKEISPIGLSDTSALSKIHDDLKNYFDVDGGRAVLVYNLEQLQAYEILMVLHAFCDNVEAYEKQATFIFTLNVPERIYDESEWNEENGYRITHEVLHEAWDNVLSLDKRSDLMSRVAVNTILVQDGDSCL